jgi:alkylation response protein AidB-like acyl-CoA dehydrogenase
VSIAGLRIAPDASLYTDEHEAFRLTVRRFVDTELRPRNEEFRMAHGVDRSVWRHAGEIGMLGFMIPEEYGGGGTPDFRFNAVIGQELGRLGFAFSSSFGINIDVVSPYLLELTTPEQKARWLPGFANGDLITSIALTEPGVGSDLAAISTAAKPVGDGWRISGSKTFITNGAQCDLVLVLARTGGTGARGLSLFAVEGSAPGFSRSGKLRKLGQHQANVTELYCDEVHVSRSELIGDEGSAFSYLMRNLVQERLACALGAHAQAERAFEITLDYAKQRNAFGQPIGSFQYNKFELAKARTELDLTATWLDRCITAHIRGELDPADAAKAKYWATEVQGRVVDLGVELFAGYGYMADSEIAHCWVDARVTRIFAGTNEIMREIIGRSLGL